jgi:lipopolysaccharide transport system ATP-binding protein
VTVIEARGLRKDFTVRMRRGRWRRETRTVAAVDGIDLRVEAGEMLGYIGPNGAGKSTTLKLLTKILRPTRGACWVRGRIGALIEVAAGFHPDLTGRENVFLQGAIMGMKRADIGRSLDAIVDFAGIGEFIDTPVKRYSSGMNARLGFSIAAHLDPDAMIIDEVLSVGDMTFQNRCIDRMVQFKRDGTAIVFVSHNLQAVATLCEQSIFVCNRVMASGETASVLRAYATHAHRAMPGSAATAFRVCEAALESPTGAVDEIAPGTRLVLRTTFESTRDARGLTFSIAVRLSPDSLMVYDANFTAEAIGAAGIRAGDVFTVECAFAAHLLRGMYHVECFVVDGPTHTILSPRVPLATFTVAETTSYAGVAHLGAVVRVTSATARSEAASAAGR